MRSKITARIERIAKSAVFCAYGAAIAQKGGRIVR